MSVLLSRLKKALSLPQSGQCSAAAPVNPDRSRPGCGLNRPTSLRTEGLASGLTLIEILATTVLLALGITAILNLQGATMRGGSIATTTSMASFLAESQSEWLRTMDINKVALVSQAPEQLTVSGIPCGAPPNDVCFFTRTTTIEKGKPTSTSYAVSIVVEWQDRKLVYDTVVSGIGFF